MTVMIILILVLIGSIGNNTTFGQYQTLTDFIDNPFAIHTREKNATDKKKNKNNKSNKKEYPKCTIKQLDNGKYLITMICLKHPIFWEDLFNKNIDTIWPYIKDFDKEYHLKKDTFFFSNSANPIFKNDKTQRKYNILHYIKTLVHINTHTYTAYFFPHINLNKTIELTKNELILSDSIQYAFYPARRYIQDLWPCTRINYRIAIASIDKKLVPAQENFNINKRIAYRRWYCTGKDPVKRPFYGGVCGASTQAFRISLLHPYLETHDRENHGIRYARYYGEKITWDDASIADFRQQLTLKNTSNTPIYFRYIEVEKENNILLVGISPKRFHKKTKIIKQQTGKMTTKLTKEIFWKDNKKEYHQERDSTYRQIFTGFTE